MAYMVIMQHFLGCRSDAAFNTWTNSQSRVIIDSFHMLNIQEKHHLRVFIKLPQHQLIEIFITICDHDHIHANLLFMEDDVDCCR